MQNLEQHDGMLFPSPPPPPPRPPPLSLQSDTIPGQGFRSRVLSFPSPHDTRSPLQLSNTDRQPSNICIASFLFLTLSFLSPFPLGAAQCSEGQPCACEVCRSGSQRFRCSSGMIPSAITHCCTPQTDHFWASRGAIAGSGHEVKHEFLNITRNVGA